MALLSGASLSRVAMPVRAIGGQDFSALPIFRNRPFSDRLYVL